MTTRTRRRWGAIANPHAKVFDPPPLHHIIFDLLTSPKGHHFDPRMKILLAFCSAHHPCRFECLMTMFEKNIF